MFSLVFNIRVRLLASALFCLVSSAEAGQMTLPPSITFTLPSVTAPRDKVVGSILSARSDSSTNVIASGDTCPFVQQTEVFGVPVPGMSNTYQTNVPGVGVKFGVTQGWNGGYVYAPSTTNAAPGQILSVRHYRKAEFVVTGQLSQGTVIDPPYMVVTYSGSCFPTVSYRVDISGGQTTFTPHTCTVLSSHVNVVLPDVASSDLKVVSSTKGDTPFTIDLECTAGSNVYVTLTDKNDLSNRTGVLSLDPSSTASGVGIEISMREQKIRFGPDSAVAKTENQVFVGASDPSLGSIPFTARYISKGNIKAGTVRATAMFTMSYQ